MGPLHLAIVLGCAALVLSAGEPKKCPDIDTVEKFDIDKYLGLWFEIQKFPNLLQSKCESARFNRFENETVKVENSMCYLDNKISIVGSAIEESDGSLETGKLKVRFPVMKNKESQYYVLDTDYDGYSIVYSCQEPTNTQPQPVQRLWVLGKETKLTEDQKKTVADKLKKLELDGLELTDIDQKNCCYDATKYDDGNSAASIGLSMALLLSTVMVRFL